MTDPYLLMYCTIHSADINYTNSVQRSKNKIQIACFYVSWPGALPRTLDIFLASFFSPNLGTLLGYFLQLAETCHVYGFLYISIINFFFKDPASEGQECNRVRQMLALVFKGALSCWLFRPSDGCYSEPLIFAFFHSWHYFLLCNWHKTPAWRQQWYHASFMWQCQALDICNSFQN